MEAHKVGHQAREYEEEHAAGVQKTQEKESGIKVHTYGRKPAPRSSIVVSGDKAYIPPQKYDRRAVHVRKGFLHQSASEAQSGKRTRDRLMSLPPAKLKRLRAISSVGDAAAPRKRRGASMLRELDSQALDHLLSALDERRAQVQREKQKLQASDPELVASIELVEPDDNSPLMGGEKKDVEAALAKLPESRQSAIRELSAQTQAYVTGVRTKEQFEAETKKRKEAAEKAKAKGKGNSKNN